MSASANAGVRGNFLLGIFPSDHGGNPRRRRLRPQHRRNKHRQCNKLLTKDKSMKTKESVLNWDFPYGFLPTTSVRLFRYFLPAPQICKDFFQSTLVFSLAQVTICRQLRLSTHFSMPSEDTSSVVSIVFMRVLSLFASSRCCC